MEKYSTSTSLLLNAKNGTLDLKTGKLRAHRREDYITKILEIEYREELRGMSEVHEVPRPKLSTAMLALIGYAVRMLGYLLTGLTSEQCWWMFHGLTASGKSTLIRIAHHGLLGPYAFALPEGYFLLSKNNSDFTKAHLAGVRLATCVETNEGRRLDVAKIKELTGSDVISAALKHQNLFQFVPQCKLVLGTNHKAIVASGL